jgi:hypothetical protein
MERVAGLRHDHSAQRHGVVGALGLLVGGEAQQPVRGVRELRLGDRELVLLTRITPATVADAVRPRHEHDS